MSTKARKTIGPRKRKVPQLQLSKGRLKACSERRFGKEVKKG